MDLSQLLSRQGQRLLQIGIVLILYSSIDGFAIPYLGRPSSWTASRSVFQETLIKALAYSSAPTDVIAFVLNLRGLRLGGVQPHGQRCGLIAP